MCQVREKYHVLKCVKNSVCECIGIFDSENEANIFRAEKEKEITDQDLFVCVYRVPL